MSFSSDNAEIVVVPGGGPIDRRSVGVPKGSADGPALLTAVEDLGQRTIAVQAVQLREVPDGIVALSEETATELSLGSGDVPWRLVLRDVQPIRRLQLELSSERPLEDVERTIASELLGRLVWRPSSDEELWVDLDSVPFRVREIDAPSGLLVVTEQTRIECFAPSARSGLDIVILADCSGSMSIDDVRGGVEGFGGGHLSRTAALQRALRELLEVRLRSAGRSSRVAMLEFTRETHAWFPRDGGMRQLDGGADAAVVEEFRRAIGNLSPRNAGTDIGNALSDAAELLHKHGHEENEPLIVLVSDGAHWVPQGEEGTGEVLLATEEPVSLMTHLHRDLGIRLHAIGISNDEMYRSWLQRSRQADHVSWQPNHELLAELVRAAGGDEATIGGMAELSQYFSGLGAGIVHHVRGRLERRPQRLDLRPEAQRLLERSGSREEVQNDAARGRAERLLVEVAGRCNAAQPNRSTLVFKRLAVRGWAGRSTAVTDEASVARALNSLGSSFRLQGASSGPRWEAVREFVEQVLESVADGEVERSLLPEHVAGAEPSELYASVLETFRLLVEGLHGELLEFIPEDDVEVATPTAAAASVLSGDDLARVVEQPGGAAQDGGWTFLD